MKRRYAELSRTGSAGPANELDERIMKAMVDEVDILGDTTGSSVAGIETRGKYVQHNLNGERGF